jgi:hypothetical protein
MASRKAIVSIGFSHGHREFGGLPNSQDISTGVLLDYCEYQTAGAATDQGLSRRRYFPAAENVKLVTLRSGETESQSVAGGWQSFGDIRQATMRRANLMGRSTGAAASP